ncbi:MAG: hypothetical protein V1799_19400 [bacterium]
MAKNKFMTIDCPYCHKATKMELVGDMQAENGGEALKVWYRCTRCKHSALIDKQVIQKAKGGSLEKISREQCTTYTKEQVFNIGQSIYHTDWDDMGTVLNKQKTSDGTHSITVSFEKIGERRLLENAPNVEPEEPGESIPQVSEHHIVQEPSA